MTAFLFARIVGVPAPQGSKSFKGMVRSRKTGKMVPRLMESSKAVAPWRDAVALQVADILAKKPVFFDDAVRMTATFIMPRKGEPKGWTRHHTRAPDIDKMVRSTCDALKTAGAWRDDSIVVELVVRKVTAEEGEPAGCHLIIEALPPKEKPVVEKKQRAGIARKNTGPGRRRNRGGGSEQPALAV